MSTWRTLLTPNVSKYIRSPNKENYSINLNETPLNEPSGKSNYQFSQQNLTSNRIETSEFGDGSLKKLKYQEKLDKIQREILQLKKKGESFNEGNSLSKLNENYKKDQEFSRKEIIPEENQTNFINNEEVEKIDFFNDQDFTSRKNSRKSFFKHIFMNIEYFLRQLLQ